MLFFHVGDHKQNAKYGIILRGNSSCFIDFETVQLQASVYSFVTLGKLFNVSKNQFYHVGNENNISVFLSKKLATPRSCA